MERKNVSSSNVKSIGFDEKNKVLEIEFHSGGIYQYSNVENDVYNKLMNASSKGGFVHRFIKGRYPTKRIR